MNSKPLLLGSLLAIIAFSGYLLISEKTLVNSDSERATFSEWQQCLKEKWNPFCNQTKDPQEIQKCNNVYSGITQCEVHNDACNRFFIYFEEPEEDAPLPDCFYQCTKACQQFATGDIYAETNYQIQHYECAYKN
ncbi:transmembrane protein, putative (macronuclear) [Tetrahymena thermophila SB210]|uniref:Transmembrane protein, putative n=1 Tax=Tetrahymena thermophila (strain SB210) TaxID=312017 RepID=Q22NZ8_TETTS|nr:transmembrane protein, putative [Tetrahymena thermophila SB210]EAR87013.1 transmembrane protein, putative [Tetrahymena thermophila SB210]|eukprot:XP_001007258.1 transmembrane protein, putative [Tetrahymena thermophila SB210]